jgi:hypothetical protein
VELRSLTLSFNKGVGVGEENLINLTLTPTPTLTPQSLRELEVFQLTDRMTVVLTSKNGRSGNEKFQNERFQLDRERRKSP